MLRFQFKEYILLALAVLTISVCQAENDVKEQHMKVVFRMVGHEFLLQMGDSTTRILPVKKSNGRYSIHFEKELAIEPDLLSFSAIKVFEKNGIKSGYIMEVEQCESPEIVYSFEYDPLKTENLVPCKSRPLPIDCYQFYFTFLDEAEPIVETTPIQKETNNSKMIIYLLVIVAIVLGAIFYYRKKNKVVSLHDSELIIIGNYQFDKNGMKLIFNGQEEELSSKEADLLELLAANENKTLERDYILNVVWKDDGDYIGRTLDVSISKLRKKLKDDTNLKIINIRGVGYRFSVSR